MEEKEKLRSERFWLERDLASFCECTGLMPLRCWNDEEEEMYADLYDVHHTPPTAPRE